MDLRRPRGERAARVGLALAVSWLVVFAVVDLLMPSDVVPDTLFALAPLFACAVLPPRTTLIFGAVAVAMVVGSGWWNDAWGVPQQWIRLLTVVLVGGAAVGIAAVRVQREERMLRLTTIAETAQRVILPTIPAEVGTVVAATRYLSAARDALVGGDLYDYSLTPRHTRFIVGDVRGHGLPAVEQAARTIRAFRQAAAVDQSLVEVAREMDAYMSQFLPEGEFVTALLIDLTCAGTITLVSCGHPAPLLVRADKSACFLVPRPWTPLGVSRLLRRHRDPEPTTFEWRRGDRLLLYTDGLAEARDAEGGFLPLLDLAPELQTGDVDAALDDLLARVRAHLPQGALHDDLAVVLLELAPGPALSGDPA